MIVAPSGAADADSRMLGQTPHLTRQMQERMAARKPRLEEILTTEITENTENSK